VVNSGLAPGATTLLKMVTDPSLPERLDVKKPIRMMTAHDWSILLKAFDDWPFSPEVSLPSQVMHLP
jgi:transcription factor 1